MTNQEIIENIRALVKGMQPKQDISKVLLQHRCEYLLTKVAPQEYRQHQALARVVNSIAIKERLKACAPIFSQNEIPYAVIKGAVLSDTIYHDPLLRTSGDIDILIHRKDADHLKQLLTANGFVQGRVTGQGIIPFSRRELLFQTSFSHQAAPYIKKTGNMLCPYVNLDINMDLLWGESEERTNMDFVLSNTVKSELFQIAFQKLTPEMEFVSLCLHHYKDMNSLYLLASGSLRLGLFCEIYDYLHNVKPDIKTLCYLCEKLNVGRYLYTCLYQTNELFEDQIILAYLEALDAQKDLSLLDSFGLNKKEHKTWTLNLLDRVLHPNINDYIQELLTDEEKEKIKINRELM